MAREKRWLAQVEAPPLDRVEGFVRQGIEAGVSQFVALDGERVVGWADIFPAWAAAVSHCGSLGMGVLSTYRRQGLGSLVVRWGPRNALGAAFLAHLVMVLLLAVFGVACGFRLSYWVGIALIAGCLLLEHLIARRRSLDWVNLAFFRMNALVSTIFLLVTVAEIVFPFFRPRRG